jgi:hypothetical protein
MMNLTEGSMKLIPANIRFATGLVLLLGCCGPTGAQAVANGAADPSGVLKLTGLSWDKTGAQLIVVQIQRRTERPSSMGVLRTMTLTARLRRALHETSAEGNDIQIEIDPAKVSHQLVVRPGQLNPWEPGTITAMAVKPTDNALRYEFSGIAEVLGMRTPCWIPATDIQLLEDAVLKLRTVGALPGCNLPRADAEKLMDDYVLDNYYLWALGATSLAARDDRPASDRLWREWGRSRAVGTYVPLSAQQFLWLDHCNELLSEGIRPNTEQRFQMLRQSLKRFVDVPSTRPVLGQN